MTEQFVMVAHGTRKSDGVAMVGDLAQRVAGLLHQPVRVAFVDVLGPSLSEVLTSLPEESVTVVPAFLARGYHVRVDIPAHIADSGRYDVTVTPALGPDPQIVRVLVDRLLESGWRPGDAVVLAAAGSADRLAQRDLRLVATQLSAALGERVELAYTAVTAATSEPSVVDAVAALRSSGRRVIIASYLLADGLFQDRLHCAGADIVTKPLGTHPGTARLIASRFRRAAVLTQARAS